MSKDTDPALYESNFERMDGDRYWTQPWLTTALMDKIELPEYIWEPAAGRGDIVNQLRDFGLEVLATDTDLSEFDSPSCYSFVADFLSIDEPPVHITAGGDSVFPQAIVTNPPYNDPRGVAEKFVRHAVNMLREDDDGLKLVAMLLRAEFCKAKTRRDLFGECKEYAGEIVLTTRPRWDWWFRDKPKASPRHNFSWFLWTHKNTTPPVQRFHYR